MSKHSLPEWVGWLMVTVAVVLIFPSFFTMYEANNEAIWNDKILQYGILYSLGTVFWAFASWIIVFILMALGIDTIRSRDTHA
jgi:hypothetical protein